MTMPKPGVYPGMPMADYLALPAFSASVASDLVDFCPRAAFHSSYLNNSPRDADDTAASDAGSIAHGILLEGSTSNVEIIDPQDYPAKGTGSIPEGWTNKGIQDARDAARAAGKIPVLAPAMLKIESMVDAAAAYIAGLQQTEPAIWSAFQPDGGDSELSMLWQDGPTLCRMRPDRINRERTLIIDPKFTGTSAEPDRFGRTQMINMGYYVRAAFYRRGCKAMFGTEPDYVFLVVENKPPYLCSLVGVDPHGLELGAEKCAYALKQWARCVERDHWPAYPSRVCYPEIPPWEEARWLERQGIETDAQGIPYDVSKLFQRKDIAA